MPQNETPITDTFRAAIFEYLDGLRSTALAQLTTEFAVSEQDAKAVLVAWMKTFTEEQPPEVRAERAIFLDEHGGAR